MGTEFVSCLSFFLFSCQLSQAYYLMDQVLWQLLWRQWCIKQTYELHAQAHLHATDHRKNTVITKTLVMWLLIHATCQWPYHCAVLLLFIQVYLESEKDCNACHDLWNNTLFCLAEQNIWLYFLAYRQIINNSHLILPQLLPSLPLFFIIPLSALSALLLPFSPIWYHTYAVVSMIYGRARCPAPVIYAAAHQLVHSRGLRPLLQPKGGLLDSHGYAYWVTLWDKHCCTGSHPPLTMLYE